MSSAHYNAFGVRGGVISQAKRDDKIKPSLIGPGPAYNPSINNLSSVKHTPSCSFAKARMTHSRQLFAKLERIASETPSPAEYAPTPTKWSSGFSFGKARSVHSRNLWDKQERVSMEQPSPGQYDPQK
mmetsp:Transcript_13231/g.36569  ORF Transcript_13231/g.36569 Transcript_13231/m.36569 type:complete len:128 (+) Transcript_13231:197-580(+)